MKFSDVFPFDRKKYSFAIDFFNEYTQWYRFLDAFQHLAEGIDGTLEEEAGINLPHAYDQEMRQGPYIWEGLCLYGIHEQVFDFREFAIIMLIASKVFLLDMVEKNVKEVHYFKKVIPYSEIKKEMDEAVIKFRKNFFDPIWIREQFYGEGEVEDSAGDYTGEYHGKEWGEQWYETYGKLLSFDDVDQIVEEQFMRYYGLLK